jgi:hypothetical protein
MGGTPSGSCLALPIHAVAAHRRSECARSRGRPRSPLYYLGPRGNPCRGARATSTILLPLPIHARREGRRTIGAGQSSPPPCTRLDSQHRAAGVAGAFETLLQLGFQAAELFRRHAAPSSSSKIGRRIDERAGGPGGIVEQRLVPGGCTSAQCRCRPRSDLGSKMANLDLQARHQSSHPLPR